MSFTEKHSAAGWINDIVQILDKNQLTFMDLLRQLLRYGHVFANLAPHKANVVLNVEPILELLFEVSAEGLKQAGGKFMTEVYRDELLHLVDKQQGFHFGARTATLEQLEEFSIEQLAQKMGVLCPHLSDLLIALLDAKAIRRRRTQPETEPTDDDDSMSEEEERMIPEKETELEDEDEDDEDWEDISNSDSDSSSEDGDAEDPNSSDSDISIDMGTSHEFLRVLMTRLALITRELSHF